MLNIDAVTIKFELDEAGHGNKEGIYAHYCGLYNCSKATLQRAIRTHFGRQKKVDRAKVHAAELIDKIAELKMQGLLLTKGASVQRELSTDHCIQILMDRGEPGAELLTRSTVNRRLNERGFRIKQARTRIETPYANFEWQMDFSRSKYFQVHKWDKNLNDYLLKVSGRELHYKMDDKRLRTWIVQVKESYSRIRQVYAYASAGESVLIGLDALHRIFNRIDEDPHPLRHAPETLKTDNGAFIKRTETKTALAALGIEPQRSKAGNKESQGKVESGFRSMWMEFELPIAVKLGDGATIHLRDYADLLHQFCIDELAKEHPYIVGQSRGEAYARSIQQHPQTYIEADVLEHAFRTETREVDQSRLFSYAGVQYQAADFAAGKTIRVYKNLNGDVMGEVVDTFGKPFHCIPPMDGFKYPARLSGNYEHRPHATYRQQLETQVEASEKEAKKERQTQTYQRDNEVFFPPRETKREIESPFAIRDTVVDFSNVTQAKIYAATRLRGLGYEYTDYDYAFDDIMQDVPTRAQIDKRINDLRVVLHDTFAESF